MNGELKEFEIRWRKGREDGGGCVEAASGEKNMRETERQVKRSVCEGEGVRVEGKRDSK